MDLITIGIILVSILLIALVALQERSSGIGVFGGGGGDSVYQQRRGLEKTLFRTTVAAITLFAGLSILHLILG